MKTNNKLINTNNMTRDEWLEQRRKGIGGSDASVIVGMNKYTSLYTLWADKMGMLPPVEDNEAMRIGRDLEDYVAQRFTEETGKKVKKKNAIIIHNDYDFVFANIDREIVSENAGLECKTTSALNLKMFRNGEFPENYYAQCVHYMAVTGADKWYLAVLIFGSGFKVFEIERDEEEIESLMSAEKDFWETYVLGETAPEIDGSISTKNAIEQSIDMDTKNYADDEIQINEEDAIIKLETLEEEKKKLLEEIESAKNVLKLAMDKHTLALCHNYKISWKWQKKTSYDMTKLMVDFKNIDFENYKKVSNYRVFKTTKLL